MARSTDVKRDRIHLWIDPSTKRKLAFEKLQL